MPSSVGSQSVGDMPRTDLEWLQGHFEALFVSDHRARLVVRHWGGEGLAPRFVFGRTRLGCMWRFGAGEADEVVRTLPLVDPEHEVWLSHLRSDDYARLPSTHRYRLRLGTSLWLGSRNTLQLHADVIDVRPITQGEPAGYRLEPAADDGHLVMIAAGTANGVTPLPDGRCPFHHDRHRMPLHEAPHMHTSMCLVARGATVPAIGDWVDVQRPLTMTAVDQYDWR